jgi:hypothetical protein
VDKVVHPSYTPIVKEDDEKSSGPVATIVSWMGGEHWYIGEAQFLRLEEAIAACERQGVAYRVVRDPHHLYERDGD